MLETIRSGHFHTIRDGTRGESRDPLFGRLGGREVDPGLRP
jgi:hypothetical protein